MTNECNRVIDKVVTYIRNHGHHPRTQAMTENPPRKYMVFSVDGPGGLSRLSGEGGPTTYVSLAIEEVVTKIVLGLMTDPSTHAALSKCINTEHNRKNAALRSEKRTKPLEDAVRMLPNGTWKEIVRDMKMRGVIEPDGDAAYLIVENGVPKSEWERLLVSTIPSKISRIKKGLFFAEPVLQK